MFFTYPQENIPCDTCRYANTQYRDPIHYLNNKITQPPHLSAKPLEVPEDLIFVSARWDNLNLSFLYMNMCIFCICMFVYLCLCTCVFVFEYLCIWVYSLHYISPVVSLNTRPAKLVWFGEKLLFLSVQFKVYTIENKQCTLYTVHYILYTVYCTVYTAQYIM